VLSDLSMDVEALLQAAADSGAIKEEGELPDHIRRLWSTYNTVINSACLGPELRLLQVKNERRQAAHANATWSGTETPAPPHPRDSMDLDIKHVNETTLMTNFGTAQLHYPDPNPRGMFQMCRERQPGFHPTRNAA
jgi:hypothetical protein